MTDKVTYGQLNSDKGKIYAETLNKAALRQIAQWCATAYEALEKDMKPAEQADATFYLDCNMLLNKLADHAG